MLEVLIASAKIGMTLIVVIALHELDGVCMDIRIVVSLLKDFVC